MAPQPATPPAVELALALEIPERGRPRVQAALAEDLGVDICKRQSRAALCTSYGESVTKSTEGGGVGMARTPGAGAGHELLEGLGAGPPRGAEQPLAGGKDRVTRSRIQPLRYNSPFK